MLRLISGSQLLGITKMEIKMKDRLNEENIKAQFDKVKHKAGVIGLVKKWKTSSK